MNLLARSKLARHLISPSLAIHQCNCYCTKAKNQETKEPPSAKRVQESVYQPQVANLVTLIGHVTEPVQFEPSIEGGLAAIVISQGSISELEIPVIFEGDLAHVVDCHVKVNDCVFVSGKVSVDPVRLLLNKGLGEFHVVAKDLNFVDGFPGVKIEKTSVKSKKIVDENDCQNLNKEAVDKADAYTAVEYSSVGAVALYSDAEPVVTSESRDHGMEFRMENGTYKQKLEFDVPGGKNDAEGGDFPSSSLEDPSEWKDNRLGGNLEAPNVKHQETGG